MSSALDHELEQEAQRMSSVRRQGPRPREDEPKAPTSASEWRRDEPELHTLPSGNTALLTRPRTLDMIRKGEIPNPLLEVAIDAASGGRPADPAAAIDFLDFMVSRAFLEPKVALDDEAGPGELSVEDLSDADKNYVLIWVQRGVAGLASFRSLGESPAPGSDGRGLRDEAE